MLMWISGFLLVPTFQDWCGIPLLVVGTALLFLWGTQWRRPEGVASLGATRAWIVGLGAEELLVGALTGLPAGISTAWPWFLAIPIPWWVGPALLLFGLSLLAAAAIEVMPPEWLLPVRGRWARLLGACLGTIALFAVSPCWVFLALLWKGAPWTLDPVQLLAARAATLVLGTVVLLYTGSFVRAFHAVGARHPFRTPPGGLAVGS